MKQHYYSSTEKTYVYRGYVVSGRHGRWYSYCMGQDLSVVTLAQMKWMIRRLAYAGV